VQVEDLLDEALVGVVGRVEEDERERRDDQDAGRNGEELEAATEDGSQSSRRKSKTA
jgi:hypothetical protein